MLKKLQLLYPNLILTNQKPEDHFGHFYWFTLKTNEWFGIPKQDIMDNQLVLLKSLFDYFQPIGNTILSSPSAQNWHRYLMEKGPIPPHEHGLTFRNIFFQWSTGKINRHDFESALHAFFHSEIIIIWEDECNGIIIEPKSNHSLVENDFLAMFETMRTDFFIEPFIYIGKFRSLSEAFHPLFQHERALYLDAIRANSQDKLLYFEKIVPSQLAFHLPDSMKKIIQHDILPVLYEDNELFSTIKSFLLNNMNASMTSKSLFIHRNTLQYRLDKFTEKTGIPLKDFHSAITVYSACEIMEKTK
ncbi:PucR family transcriptional regulator [Bacillus sp. CGMCC 1.16607]|uniref:PucR family transcriptional regulator n=1 Tax=Bacillus sp. CGMCC 1.16607 TaxID=3351842 RepID=UPI0036448A04